MKTKALFIACLLFFASQALAETLYITDRINATFRSGPGTQYSIIKGLPSGTSVQVIDRAKKWSRVTEEGGADGWVLTQWLVSKPTQGVLLNTLKVTHSALVKTHAKTQSELSKLQAENAQLKNQLATSDEAASSSETSYQQLKKKSANFLQLEEDYKETKHQLENLSKKADILNDRLSKKNMVWFLAGGGVLLVGFIIGSSSRKKKASYC